MASNMLFSFSRGLSRKWLSTSSVRASLAEAPSYVPETPASPSSSPRFGPVEVTKLSNGVTVASRDCSSPYSNISVFIKSGSRSEEYSQRGLTHLLANTAFLSTTNKSGFTISRELEHVGVNFNSVNTREFVVYNAVSPRGTEDAVVGAFGSLISSPALYHWEVKDEWPSLSVDRNDALSNPSSVVMEELHKYAFRTGLSNSLFCPSYNDTKFDSEAVRDFRKNYYIGQNTTIIGVGVDHKDLVELTTNSFSSLPDLLPRPSQKSEYVGGGEVRIDANTTSVNAAIACKGASLTGNPKDLVASNVLQHILGERQYIKWGSGSATSRLRKAVASTVDAPFEINALNINYSDNGLFGMYAVANGNVIGQVLKSALLEFTEVAKGNFSSDDLERAKNQLKTRISDESERRSSDVNSIARQVCFNGSYSDVTASTIDSVTAQDVNKYAKMVFATRPTLVVHGNLCDMPRLDELLTGVSVKETVTNTTD